jgi:type IV pilus assembly protein PilM
MQNGTHKSSAPARWWGRLWNSPLPSLGCEISQSGISIARWSGDARLETAAWKPLPAGVVEASPLRENIPQPDEVRKAFAEALASLGISNTAESSRRPTEVVLVIPDQAARLFVLNFDTFPQKSAEGLPLVKWRLKKSVPFDVETAAISYFVQRSGAEQQVVAVVTPQWIIRKYEAIPESFGLRPRRVILSTLASLGLAGEVTAGLPPDGRVGVLVAKYSPPWFTTAVLQGGALRLFRTVGLSAGENGSLSPAEVLAAIYPSVVYFQDSFQGMIARGYLSGLGESTASISSALEGELHLQASPLVPNPDALVSGFEPLRAEQCFAALLGVAQEQQIR